jgi:cellobiose dehydrogenase (acceptor)
MFRFCILALFVLHTFCKEYDIIFVGAGTANSIVISKIVQEFPYKQILLIDAGGPLSKKVGGTDFPQYSQDVAIVDVPGEYNNVAWRPLGDKYKVKEAAFTWQGMGYGGNSQFNGMLFQSVPVNNMDKWPAGWKSNDLLPYYQSVIQKAHVTPVPSADGKNYLTDIADAMRAVFTASNLPEVDTKILTNQLENSDGYFSRPYVVTDGNGQRGGIVDAYLMNIINSQGTSKKSNLDIVTLAKVSKLIVDASGAATGVEYYVRSTQQDLSSPTNQGTKQTATLIEGGRVILGAGALITPRILYLSGIGPSGKEATLGTSLNFFINNPAVGSILTDHIGTQIGVSLVGGTNYDQSEYTKNAADISKYLSTRSGPYSQYAPVLLAHVKSDPSLAHPNIEIKINPTPNGGTNSNYNSDATNEFQILLISLDQKATTQLKLDADGFVQYPSVYFSNAVDVDQMVDALYNFLNVMLPKNPKLSLVFGPGGLSHPTLDPTNKADLRKYVASYGNKDGVPYSNMIMNHFTGTVPLLEDPAAGGVDPTTLIVRGTTNIHVVDASLYKPPVVAHPVATVMAGAERAADLISALLHSLEPTETTAEPSTGSPSTTSSPGVTTTSTFASKTTTSSPTSKTTTKPTVPSSSTSNPPTTTASPTGVPQSGRNTSSDSAIIIVSAILLLVSIVVAM